MQVSWALCRGKHTKTILSKDSRHDCTNKCSQIAEILSFSHVSRTQQSLQALINLLIMFELHKK